MRWCLRICDDSPTGAAGCGTDLMVDSRGAGTDENRGARTHLASSSFRAFRFAARYPCARRGRCPHRPVAEAPSTTGQRQRKEKQLNAMTTPTTTAPSATGRQYRPRRRPKRVRRQAQIGACTDTPTPVQQLCTHVQSCGQSAFFSYTGRGAFSFWARPKREWGAHPPWKRPPAGAGIPLAAVRRPHRTRCRVYPANAPSHGTPPINQR